MRVFSFTTRQTLILRWLHALCAVILLTGVTWGLLSVSPLKAVRGTPLQWVRHVHDVVMHLGLYTVITVMVLPLAGDSWFRTRAALIAAVVTHAVGTELIQSFIPRRTCDPADLLGNLLGIALGAWLAGAVVRLRTEGQRPLLPGISATASAAQRV